MQSSSQRKLRFQPVPTLSSRRGGDDLRAPRTVDLDADGRRDTESCPVA